MVGMAEQTQDASNVPRSSLGQVQRSWRWVPPHKSWASHGAVSTSFATTARLPPPHALVATGCPPPCPPVGLSVPQEPRVGVPDPAPRPPIVKPAPGRQQAPAHQAMAASAMTPCRQGRT